jgi:hypothetical protein
MVALRLLTQAFRATVGPIRCLKTNLFIPHNVSMAKRTGTGQADHQDAGTRKCRGPDLSGKQIRRI